jgi:hypothetical protein
MASTGLSAEITFMTLAGSEHQLVTDTQVFKDEGAHTQNEAINNASGSRAVHEQKCNQSGLQESYVLPK